MYGRRPRCKRNLTISEAFGCGHVSAFECGRLALAADPLIGRKHVWTAPAVQEESDISAKRSGAAMYSAFECSRYGRWP